LTGGIQDAAIVAASTAIAADREPAGSNGGGRGGGNDGRSSLIDSCIIK